jgi:hypothetical protein
MGGQPTPASDVQPDANLTQSGALYTAIRQLLDVLLQPLTGLYMGGLCKPFAIREMHSLAAMRCKLLKTRRDRGEEFCFRDDVQTARPLLCA